jgi:hypothetical protein
MHAIVIPSPTPAEEPLDDATPEVKLAAALQVWGGDLIVSSGQLTEQHERAGEVDPWLLAGMRRAVARLQEALDAFKREKDANG